MIQYLYKGSNKSIMEGQELLKMSLINSQSRKSALKDHKIGIKTFNQET